MKFWNGYPMRSRYSSDSYDLDCSLKGYLKSLGEYYYPRKTKKKSGRKNADKMD